MSIFRAWYTVFLSALIGCGLQASFPQFSLTVYQLSEVSGIKPDLLLLGESVKSGAIVLAMLLSGFVYKKLGCRLTFALSILVVIIPQCIMPAVNSVFVFFTLKFIQGMGALSFPLFLVLIMNWMPVKHTGLSTAVFNGLFYGGGGIGGTLAGFIIVKSGWQASYYISAAVIAGLSLLWLLTIKEGPESHEAAPPIKDEATFHAAAEKGFWKDCRVWLLALALFGTTWSVQAITVDLPLFGMFLGYDELTIGKVLSGVTAAMIISCIVSGKVSDYFAGKCADRSRARLLVLLGGYLLTLAALCLFTFTAAAKISVFTISAFLLTFGSAWGLGVFYSILPEIYDKEKVPLATGITGGVGDMGMPAAPFFVGVLFGSRGLWQTGWAMCALVIAFSIAAIVILLRIIKKPLKIAARNEGAPKSASSRYGADPIVKRFSLALESCG
jgi:MFS family permease